MDYRGLIWVDGDEIITAIEATVMIDGGRLSIASRGESLGSWPVDKVVVEPRGDSDFILAMESDRIMFRPRTRSGYMAFDMATTGQSSVSDRIRASAAEPSQGDLAADSPVSQRSPVALPPASSEKTGWDAWSGTKKVSVVGIVLVVVLIVGLVSSGGGTTAPSLPCYPVASSWLPDLNVPSAKTVLAPDRDGAWIVAAPNGAVWVMTGNPRFETGGLVLPLNGTARATSDLGILVSPGAPAYQGMTMDEPGVAEALACAKG